MTNKINLLSFAAVAALAMTTGCMNNEYLERRDTISIGVGDAVAHNRAVQTINPRPNHAYRTRLSHDGARMNNAMESYRTPSGSEDADSPSDASSKNANADPSGLSPQ